jgi:hypothetical protein
MFTRYESLSRKLRLVLFIVISSGIYTQAFAQPRHSNDQYYPEISIDKLIDLEKPFMTESILFKTPASIAFLIPEDSRDSVYQPISELLSMAPDINVPVIDLDKWALVNDSSDSLYAETFDFQTLNVSLLAEAYVNIVDTSLQDDIERIQAAPNPEGILSITSVLTGLLWQVDKNMDISLVQEILLDTLSTNSGDSFSVDNNPATEPKQAILLKLAWRF